MSSACSFVLKKHFFFFRYLGQKTPKISQQDSTKSSETCTAKQHDAKCVPDSDRAIQDDFLQKDFLNLVKMFQ